MTQIVIPRNNKNYFKSNSNRYLFSRRLCRTLYKKITCLDRSQQHIAQDNIFNLINIVYNKKKTKNIEKTSVNNFDRGGEKNSKMF